MGPVDDGVVLVDAAGMVRALGATAAGLLGAEAVGRRLDAILDGGALAEAVRIPLLGGETPLTMVILPPADAAPPAIHPLLSSTDVSLIELEASGRVLALSPAAEALTGWTLRDLRGRDWVASVVPEADQAAAREAFAALAAAAPPASAVWETPIRSRAGRVRAIRWRASLSVGPDGARRVACLGVDVTDLRESEQRFSAIFRSSPAPMTLSTVADGRYIDVNPAFERATGHARDAVVGRTVGEVGIWVDASFRETMVHQLRTKGIAEGLTARFRRADGSIGHTRGGAATFELAGELCLVGVFQDVTDEEDARRRLQRASQDLARINRELVCIAQAAAHDLAEPAREVCLLSTILRRRLTSEDVDVTRDLGAIHDGARRLYHMVGDLLRYTEIGLEPPAVTPVDLDAVMRAATRAAMDETGQAADVTWDSLPTIPGGRAELLTLFTELLKNAIQAARPGQTVRVAIDAAADEDGGVHVRLVDTGRGFDTAYLDHVIGLFRRLGPKDERHSGVGLAIARRIAELHGGWLSIESAEGVGTTARVWLNMAPRPDPG